MQTEHDASANAAGGTERNEEFASSMTSLERGFSYQVAAAKCEEVSSQLVRLAELLRCTRPDPSAPECPLSQRAMVECLIRGRRLRERFFEPVLFADPVWDILLDLYLAKLEQRETTVAGLCAASGVPESTATRHIDSLIKRGLITREPSHFSAQVVRIELADTSFERMRSYFQRFFELLAAAAGR